jgi:hypothetical protein
MPASPEHEQEHRGATPEIRHSNDAGVTLVIGSALCSLLDENGLGALPFQKPSSAAESEAL